MMSKNILINGFPRSGTTYLAVQLNKNFPKKVLMEPLYLDLGREIKTNLRGKPSLLFEIAHKKLTEKFLFRNYYENFGDKIFEIIIKYHPSLDHDSVFFDIQKLKTYLMFFKDFHIKETKLHFYLNEDFITDNWDVYVIIRHPIDTFISYIKAFLNFRLLRKVLHFEHFPILSKIVRRLDISDRFIKCNWHKILNAYVDVRLNPTKLTYKHKFLLVWIVLNYFAVKAIPAKKIVIYDNPKTYKRLPFELKDPLRITIYPKARENLAYEFEKIAKELGLEEEYNYLLKFFKT